VNGLVVMLQWALALSSLPLAVMSVRSSRAHRQRHARFMATAIALATVATVLVMISLALLWSDEEPVDHGMSFGPPVLTLVAALLVIYRALQASRMTRRPRRP